MGITRKALSAMGIEEAQADEIIKMHLDTVNPIKDERDALKANVSKMEAVQTELNELKEASKNSDRSPYKAKYEDLLTQNEALQKEYDSYKADIEAKATLDAKKTAYRKLLSEAGVSEKRIGSVLRLAEVDGKLDGIEFDDEGKVKGLEDITKNISEDYSDYIVSQETTGAATVTPPSNTVPELNVPSRATQMALQYHANLYGGQVKED